MHVDKNLPQVVSDLRASRSFFDITGLDCSFLHHPADMWPGIASYQEALHIVTNIPCVNDCAERGVALIQEFNASVKHEDRGSSCYRSQNNTEEISNHAIAVTLLTYSLFLRTSTATVAVLNNHASSVV
jgi:hypothetical protein